MERTIRVTGKGNLSVKPDTVRLIMTMEGMKEEYDASLAESANMTEHLKQMFSDLGFERDDIKTLSFNVNAEYESYQAKDLLARADWAFSPSSKVDLIVQKAIIDKQYDIYQLNLVLFQYTNEILGV